MRAFASIGVLLLANAISDGKLAEMQALLASGSAEPKEIDAMAADRGVFLGTIALLAGGAPGRPSAVRPGAPASPGRRAVPRATPP